MSAFTYPARFTAGGDGRVLVEFVDLPRVSTDGKDAPEAMEEAMDALGSDLSIRLSPREEIPAPSAAKRGQRPVCALRAGRGCGGVLRGGDCRGGRVETPPNRRGPGCPWLPATAPRPALPP